MCGDQPHSGDFMLFEMLDQHVSIAKAVGALALAPFPKLKKLHEATSGAFPGARRGASHS